jgi:hypothetical protein
MKEVFIKTWYYWVIFILVSIIFGILKRYTNKITGFVGEKSVARFLSKLDPKKYKVINDLMVNIEGNTTQIDHVVISNFGIFVIETKNYYGWIIGDESSDHWTKLIYENKNIKQIDNPIKQNNWHIKVLKNLLKEYQDIIYFPIIVFTRRSYLSVKTITDVVLNTKLLLTINKYKTEIISDQVRDKIYNLLSILNIKTRSIRREHISRLQEKKNSKINNNICPECGGLLVLRNSKHGEFMGCSNYPECKFTINI